MSWGADAMSRPLRGGGVDEEYKNKNKNKDKEPEQGKKQEERERGTHTLTGQIALQGN